MILRKPFYPKFTVPAIHFRVLMRLHKNMGRDDGHRFHAVMREQVQQSRQVASEHSDCDPMGAVVLKTQPNTPCLLYTSPSPRDRQKSRMPSSA